MREYRHRACQYPPLCTRYKPAYALRNVPNSGCFPNCRMQGFRSRRLMSARSTACPSSTYSLACNFQVAVRSSPFRDGLLSSIAQLSKWINDAAKKPEHWIGQFPKKQDRVLPERFRVVAVADLGNDQRQRWCYQMPPAENAVRTPRPPLRTGCLQRLLGSPGRCKVTGYSIHRFLE